ncbi:MAG: undecaprenyl/decaprenyl-phosphate alpha-N-acetylglucosaminyl 1-phosphate transferase [Desulfobacterota bacterium]|nr:undecaprenyl/decaprenyl-phosphate alpha-N-acetylglucosaminyl 1-phosphate transferase [Thermodesulfobacteriota bacterium]
MSAYFFQYLFSFILALCVCLYITPLIIQAAHRYDIVDRPDNKLKTHREPVAYLGGIAVYLSFLFTLALTFSFSRDVLGLLLSGTIIALLGIIDDLRPLGPKIKLVGQTIAVFVLIKSGIYVQIIFLPLPLCLLITFFWLMTTINAFNIIDIMDGLSAGVGCVVAGVLFVVALLNGNHMIAIMAVSLAGALLGFLRYNFEPARIYLGDTGSTFLGLMLGALAMIGSYTERNDFGCLAPLLILGIPLFDTAFVMYIRWRRGLSVIYGSPDHFALRLRKWRLTTRQTVLASYGASLLLGVFGIAMMLSPSPLITLAILGFCCVCFFLTAWLLKKVDMSM